MKTILLGWAALLLPIFGFAQSTIWSKDCAPAVREAYAASFSADGSKVISGSACHPAYVRVWDAANGDLIWTHEVGGSLMCQMGAAFSSNGQYFASIEEMGNLLVFDYTTATPTLLHTIAIGSGMSSSLDFSPNGSEIAVDGNDDTIRIYQVSSGTLLRKIVGHTAAVRSVDYSPNGNWIASASNDKTVKVWNANTGALEQTLTGFLNSVVSVRFSADNSHLVAVATDGRVKVWMTNMWMLHNNFTINETSYQIDISDDNEYIIIGSRTKARVYGAMGGGLFAQFNLTAGEKVYSVDFAPNSLNCVTATGDGKISYWDVASVLSSNDLVKQPLSVGFYPNPSRDIAVMELPEQLLGGIYFVMDAQGKTVDSGRLLQTKQQINTAGLPQGNYFIRLEKGDKIAIHSFIKQ